MKIAVLGTGSWGTALAKVLSENGHSVTMWGRDQAVIDSLNETHTNERYLKGIQLPEAISATCTMAEAVNDAQLILFVVPTNAVRLVARQLVPLLKTDSNPLLVHAGKGLEINTELRISHILSEELATVTYQGPVVLSGPSHAEEVARQDVTTLTAASSDISLAEKVQVAFMNSYLRIYTNSDVIGVELGGALKNIIAVCAGIIHGLGYGDNAKAALITRGLAEISRLGVALGADPLTFIGLSGVGDLIVTCTSIHSRNFQAGLLIAKGLTVAEVIKEVDMVVEGILTVQVAYQLAKEKTIDMPITEMLYTLLYAETDLTVKEAIDQLMVREGKQEASLDNQVEA